MGEQADILDDIAHPKAKRHRINVGDVLVIQEDPATARLDQAVDHLQRGGLATAGRPDQHGQLAGRELDRELAHGRLAARVELGNSCQSNH